MDVSITEAELRKALTELEVAKERGFKHSVAILHIFQAGEMIDDNKVRYDSLILKAHPTKPSKDWGRCHDPREVRLINGQCEQVYTEDD